MTVAIDVRAVRAIARSRRVWSGRPRRAGLTLLEVILALAILGGALAAIGELVRVGATAAVQARDLTTAQIQCEAKMAELTAGLEPLQSAAAVPISSGSSDDVWLYSVSVQPIDDNGLMAVQVVVEQDSQQVRRPVSYTLTKWMIDPNAQSTLSSSTGTSGSTGGTPMGSSGTSY